MLSSFYGVRPISGIYAVIPLSLILPQMQTTANKGVGSRYQEGLVIFVSNLALFFVKIIRAHYQKSSDLYKNPHQYIFFTNNKLLVY